MKAAKVLIIVLGVIIVILLGILFFYNPVQRPAVQRQTTSSTTGQ